MRHISDKKCPHCGGVSWFASDNTSRARYQCKVCRKTFYEDHPQQQEIRFVCFDHQNKGKSLADALSTKFDFWTNHHEIARVNFALSDNDVGARLGQLKRMHNGSRRFFIYPHSARPSLINAHYPTWDGVTAQFVATEQHAEVLRLYGYTRPIEPIGWHLSPVEEFKPREKVKNVLFGPIHPRNAPIDRRANQAAFNRLYKLVQDGAINLTVRHIGILKGSGLEPMPGVTYINGAMDLSNDFMDKFDVVIGHQTFAWLAVARGIPCVMFAEDMPTHFRKFKDEYHFVKCWDKVSPLFRYPLDILDTDDPMKMLTEAAACDDEIRDWKRRMIGEPMQSENLIGIVEKYL